MKDIKTLPFFLVIVGFLLYGLFSKEINPSTKPVIAITIIISVAIYFFLNFKKR